MGPNASDALARGFRAPIGEAWFLSEQELPLLVKWISTSERLSVQVHPDDGEDGPPGGWLPPLSGANAGGTLWVRPIANRPQLAKLPHNSAPSLAYTYARSQAALLMSVGVHFRVAPPRRNRIRMSAFTALH